MSIHNSEGPSLFTSADVPRQYTLSTSAQSSLSSVLESVYPSLDLASRRVLLESLVALVTLLKLRWCNPPGLEEDLFHSGNLATRALINCLLPHMEDDHLDSKKATLTSLTQLYTARGSRGEYYYSNMQYNRCYRTEEGALERVSSVEDCVANTTLFLHSVNSTANRLYVNWVDLIPVTLDRLPHWPVCTETLRKTNCLAEVEDLPQFWGGIDLAPGLSYETLYDTISNMMYDEIAYYKWLIFDYADEDGARSYLQYLEVELFSPSLWSGTAWSTLEGSESESFQRKWNTLLHSSSPVAQQITLAMYYTLVNKYSRAEELMERGVLRLYPALQTLLDDADTVDTRDPKWTRDAVHGLSRLPVEEVWTFLVEQLSHYRKTWYYHYTVGGQALPTVNLGPGWDHQVTAKNLYNIAKSLTHYQNGEGTFLPLPRFWTSLSPDQRETVVSRMRGDMEGWFTVTGYLRRLYGPGRDYLSANQALYVVLRPRLIWACLESLVYHGMLTEYRSTPSITDTSLAPDRAAMASALARTLENGNEEYRSSYYWLTGESYSLMPVQNVRSHDVDWFAYLSRFQIWTFTYAMNWVSQLSFFNKYLNNRVIMVTGSTGVGKSTQVPKLLLYAAVAFSYRPQARLVCTQPRIQPTEGNAVNVATEMGLPIRRADREGGYTSTPYYSVQYSHSMGSHRVERGPYLRFTTDGSLLGQFRQYPLLRREGRSERATVGQNLYDIVIVDEAHEHNANMDIILTAARTAAGVNNTIRLVIVSATMDDDEPRYRRYYRDVNDNHLYPQSTLLPLFRLDRAVTDRRIHISPPGATTQFPITDVYLTEAESLKVTPANYAQLGTEKTIHVANTTSSGDLLFFLAGQAEIVQAVEEINSRTAPDVIALPYYRELDADQRKVVMNVHIELPLYTRRKEDVLLPAYRVTGRVTKGTYRRAIIVSTNIAEASITIQNLRYVIDTGFAKSRVYDPITGGHSMVNERISGSSSTQRRGRVGRLAAGTVYYLYSPTTLATSPTKFKICQADPSSILGDSLISEEGDTLLYPVENDPARPHTLSRPITSATLLPLFQAFYTYNSSLPADYTRWYGLDAPGTLRADALIVSRIRSRTPPPLWNVRTGDDYTSPSPRAHVLPIPHHTGWDLDTLMDSAGQFYIIHPDEDILLREELTGKIVGIQPEAASTETYREYLLLRQKKRARCPPTPAKMELVVSRMVEEGTILAHRDGAILSPLWLDTGSVLRTLGLRLESGADSIWISSLVSRGGKGVLSSIWLSAYALCYTMSTYTVATLSSARKYRQVVEFLDKNRQRKGDMYWFFNLWKTVLEKISTTSAYQMAHHPLQLLRQFPSLVSQYLGGGGSSEDRRILVEMEREGSLDSAEAGLIYLRRRAPPRLSTLPPSLRYTVESKILNPTAVLDVINTVLTVAYRAGIELGKESGEIAQRVATQTGVAELKGGEWEILLQSYLLTHPTLRLEKRSEGYRNVDLDYTLPLAVWSRGIPLPKTLDGGGHRRYTYYTLDSGVPGPIWLTGV